MFRKDHRETRDEYREPEARRGRGLAQLIALLAVAFVVTLGVVVGTRMSSDAIAVLVGVIAGVAASIPCALLLMAVTRRQAEESEFYPGTRRGRDAHEPRPAAPPAATPPVIVVTPGSAVPQQIAPWSTTHAVIDGAQLQGRREFRVMGYEESEAQADG
jgi:hypothetical protein